MHERRRAWVQLVVLAALATATLTTRTEAQVPADVDAEFSVERKRFDPQPEKTQDMRLLVFTAYSLGRREFQMGLTGLAAGIVPQLTIGTLLAPWLAGAVYLSRVIPNFYVQSTFYDKKRWAVRLRFLYEDALEEGASGEFRAFIMPVSLNVSAIASRKIRLHLETMYVATKARAADGGEADGVDLNGAAVVDAVHLQLMLEWRLNPLLALTFRGRWVPWHGDAPVQAQLILEDNGMGQLQLTAKIVSLDNAWTAGAAAELDWAYSWGSVHLTVGLMVGGWFIGQTGLVLPDVTFAPQADLYVRFGKKR